MKWLKEEVDTAVSMIKNGESYDIVAKTLGRSKKSIKCKLSILGETYEKYNKRNKEIKNCINCGNEITTRSGKFFCGRSCSAIYNNKKRGCRKQCINCDEEIKCNRKYCSSSCQGQHTRKLIFEKIENGDTNLYFKNYKNYLIHRYGEKCMECGWCEINEYSGKIPIELEHVDGDGTNNSLDNLKLLCPSCHSLTSTYKSLNSGNGRHYRRERYRDGKSY